MAGIGGTAGASAGAGGGGGGYMAIVSKILQGIATGTQVAGTVAAYKTKGRIHLYNERALYDKADTVWHMAKYNVRRVRSAGDKLKASQRAKTGTTGVTMDSFNRVLEETAGDIERDAQLILYKGREARRQIRNQAKKHHWLARRAKREGALKAVSQGFSGASSMM